MQPLAQLEISLRIPDHKNFFAAALNVTSAPVWTSWGTSSKTRRRKGAGMRVLGVVVEKSVHRPLRFSWMLKALFDLRWLQSLHFLWAFISSSSDITEKTGGLDRVSATTLDWPEMC